MTGGKRDAGGGEGETAEVAARDRAWRLARIVEFEALGFGHNGWNAA